MIQYKLSNRQRKELDNDKLLNIALPVDADWSDDLPGSDQYRWIVDRLPEVTAESIYRVVVRRVPCDAINRPGTKMPFSSPLKATHPIAKFAKSWKMLKRYSQPTQSPGPVTVLSHKK